MEATYSTEMLLILSLMSNYYPAIPSADLSSQFCLNMELIKLNYYMLTFALRHDDDLGILIDAVFTIHVLHSFGHPCY
jgi:hypothetical protein